MDHGSFDTIARLLGSAGSRRAAIGALLGSGALGISGATAARKRRNGKKGKSGVSAQAVCAPPSNGVNRNNCTYDNEDFSGELIHSSSYKNTTWVDATLIGTDLHSSNFKGGSFRRANLTCADLSSSTLTNVNFQAANLTLADLSSSACAGAIFNTNTTWCGTRDCTGTLRNDDCPGGPPAGSCCRDTDCPAGETCEDGTCARPCPTGEPCGERSPGDTLRCCDGVCPAPTCLVNGTSCGDSTQCAAACCTGLSTCGGPSSCHCFVRDIAPGTPLAPCGSDIDCNNAFGAAWCVCGSCCVPRGHQKDARLPCSACCSGACGASQSVCA